MSGIYLAAADQLMSTSGLATRGVWPRACAWLLRLELEASLDEFWLRVQPEVAATQAQRPKLLLLPAYAGPDVGRRMSYLWWALSRAGHHHHYELGVTYAELHRHRDELVVLRGMLRDCPAPAVREIVSD